MCGLKPGEFQRMTPGEFFAIVRGKIKEIERQREDQDAFNAIRCYYAVAAAAGSKAAGTPSQYRIFGKKPAKPQIAMEWNDNLSSWVGATGGHRL